MYIYIFFYIYTIIQTMYNLNLVIGTHRIFALYIQTNSIGIWINFSDQLQNMTLRPARRRCWAFPSWPVIFGNKISPKEKHQSQLQKPISMALKSSSVDFSAHVSCCSPSFEVYPTPKSCEKPSTNMVH